MWASVAPAPLCPAMSMRDAPGVASTTLPFPSRHRFSVRSPGHDLADVWPGVEVLVPVLAELRVQTALRQHDHELLPPALLELLLGLVESDVAHRRGVRRVHPLAQALDPLVVL